MLELYIIYLTQDYTSKNMITVQVHIDGLVQDCSNSIANTLELL